MILFISLVSFIARTGSIKSICIKNRLYFGMPDVQNHLYLTHLYKTSAPWVPKYDYFGNYPMGQPITWPPLMDLVSVYINKGLQNFFKTPILEWICAWTPVFISVLTTIFFAILTGHFFKSQWIRLFATLHFTLFYPFVLYSGFGRYDHHFYEAFFMTLLVLIWTKMKKCIDNNQTKQASTNIILFSIIYYCFMMTWNGTGMFLPWIILLFTFSAPPHQFPSHTKLGLLFSILNILFLRFGSDDYLLHTISSQDQGFTMNLNQIFSFNFQILSFAAFYFLILTLWTYTPSYLNSPDKKITIIKGLILLSFAMLFVWIQKENLRNAIYFFSNKGGWITVVGEMKSLFGSIRRPFEVTGIDIGIFFIAGVAFIYKIWKKKTNFHFPMFFLIFLILLGFNQIRFLYYSNIGISLLNGWLLSEITKKIDNRKLLTALTFLLSIHFSIKLYKNYQQSYPLNPAEIAVLEHLKLKGDPLSFNGDQFSYGVLGYYNIGHAIKYYARKPSIAAPDCSGDETAPFLFLTNDYPSFIEHIHNLKIKYIILSEEFEEMYYTAKKVYDSIPRQTKILTSTYKDTIMFNLYKEAIKGTIKYPEFKTQYKISYKDKTIVLIKYLEFP